MTFLNGEQHSFDYVINAAGPWAKKLLTVNRIEQLYSLVKGSHLIVSRQTENPLFYKIMKIAELSLCCLQLKDQMGLKSKTDKI